MKLYLLGNVAPVSSQVSIVIQDGKVISMPIGKELTYSRVFLINSLFELPSFAELTQI
ncbi:MAG: hypothetical protein K2Q14_02285 [Gammaproteobacteria bacterium]|nr:hypothetical protein [Gammaproteobacteria bacterium]